MSLWQVCEIPSLTVGVLLNDLLRAKQNPNCKKGDAGTLTRTHTLGTNANRNYAAGDGGIGSVLAELNFGTPPRQFATAAFHGRE